MFSGIIAAVGQITRITPRDDGAATVRLTIDAGQLGLDDVGLGDSIACSGVCLTVVDRQDNCFSVDVSPESLACTVGLAAPGPVNLEKALRLADRLGGHLVSGHVDGVGEVLRFEAGRRQPSARSPRAGSARPVHCAQGLDHRRWRQPDDQLGRRRHFTINLIPHTLEATTLGGLQAGSRVNLEIDLIARYCERLLSHEE
jgi:riboflavin synthase